MQIKKILIGIDNSKFAEHAAEYGFNMARMLNAQVGLVHIVEPSAMPIANSADPMLGANLQDIGAVDMEMMDVQSDASNTLVENTIAKFGSDLQVTHFSEFGDTADGILSCSKEYNADIIIIGTHSRTGFDRLLMGSVAEHVVRHADVPVLVVPFKEEDQ